MSSRSDHVIAYFGAYRVATNNMLFYQLAGAKMPDHGAYNVEVKRFFRSTNSKSYWTSFQALVVMFPRNLCPKRGSSDTEDASN